MLRKINSSLFSLFALTFIAKMEEEEEAEDEAEEEEEEEDEAEDEAEYG